jgi:CDP-diacylglycerol--serine O-phosphatidyltransferase
MTSSSKLIPMQKLLPSAITVTSLCLGITSIKYSLDGNYRIAVGLVLLAAFLDGVDGRVARFLNSTSNFGAQLDSLSDMCCFGVSPAVMMYLWSLHKIPYEGAGWALTLFYVTCSALRLARFNTSVIDDQNSEFKQCKNRENYFFQGLPMPAAAILLLMPVMLTFSFLEHNFFNGLALFLGAYLLIISLLMVSQVPIYSGKNINITKEKAKFLLVFVGILFTSAILEPWILIPLLSLCYIVTILVNIIMLRKALRP